MKLEILPGTTQMVSPGVINHHGSANNSPAPWPSAKVVVILLALGQVSACPWMQAHSVFSLGCNGGGGREQSGQASWELGPVAWQRWNVLGQLFVISQRQSGVESHDQMT